MIVDFDALKDERNALGFSLRKFANEAGLSINAVRTVEGEMVRRDGALRTPQRATVERYCATLSRFGRNVTWEDFRIQGLVLRAPDFVDFRPFDAWSDDPLDTRWRSSGLLIGIGSLDVTTQTLPPITIQEVRLGTDLFATISNASETVRRLAVEGDYDHVIRQEAFCQWTAGNTQRFGANSPDELDEWLPEPRDNDKDYSHLGLVRYVNRQADRPFVPTSPIFSHEVMFSPCPKFVTFHNFVNTWAQIERDVNFVLTVTYLAGRRRDTEKVEFTVPGSTLSLYCRSALHWSKRGFPAFLQVFRDGAKDFRIQPNDPAIAPGGPWFG